MKWLSNILGRGRGGRGGTGSRGGRGGTGSRSGRGGKEKSGGLRKK